jgi:hypothetical protein
MELTLIKNKETPGSIRYGDEDGHNIYLKKTEANTLGNPENIKVSITAIV